MESEDFGWIMEKFVFLTKQNAIMQTNLDDVVVAVETQTAVLRNIEKILVKISEELDQAGDRDR